MEATEMQGTLSVHTENIFPIIKKFLYADHEIFLRELVANGIDASQKLRHLASLGTYEGSLDGLKVNISVNTEAKTVTVSDGGIGMTQEDIKKYINQVAFSGATEFIEKYKNTDASKQIIGHFGLGFYSAFMVSAKVEIFTRSYSAAANEACHWTCDGSTTYTLANTTKEEVGTDIVLHLAEDSIEFLEAHRLRGILQKYCKFLPFPVAFEGEVINNPNPIWTKNPSELKDEDYKAFYKELYPQALDEPLFWIHLNVDYPFNLTGVLYFPKLKKEFVVSKEKIHLYSRQVFITDEVKDVVPEFLMLLHGVIDSPDIPLNVSRSYLQADGNVKKINSYISRKVGDKLHEIFKNDRPAFEEKWSSLNLFVQYGMVTDDKFFDKAKSFTLLRNVENKHFTFEEYQEHIAANQTDKNGNKVALYTNDPLKQHIFIESAKKYNYDVIVIDTPLTGHFIQHLEGKIEKFRIKRVDADNVYELIGKDEKVESVLSEDDQKQLKELFVEVAADAEMEVQIASLPPDEFPVTLTIPEFNRRMKEISAMNGWDSNILRDNYKIVVNSNHSLVQKILTQTDHDQKKRLARQSFDLAMLSQNLLKGPALADFINRSLELVQK